METNTTLKLAKTLCDTFKRVGNKPSFAVACDSAEYKYHILNTTGEMLTGNIAPFFHAYEALGRPAEYRDLYNDLCA